MTPEDFKKQYPWANTDYHFDQKNGAVPGGRVPNSNSNGQTMTSHNQSDPVVGDGMDSSDGSGGDKPWWMSAAEWAKDHAGDIFNGAKSAAGAASQFASDHGGDFLTAAMVEEAMRNSGKASDFANQALDTVKGQYDSQAPLRQQGQAGMLNPGLGVAAKLNAVPQGANPYAPSHQLAASQAPPGLAPATPPPPPPQGPVDDPRYRKPGGVTTENTLGLPMDASGQHPQGYIGGTGSGPGADAWKYNTYIDPKLQQPGLAPAGGQ